MDASSIAKERGRIFSLFCKQHRLRFGDIEKALEMRSNLLTYHLDQMANEGLLRKEEGEYLLTAEAEKLIPFFAQMTGKEVAVLPVVVVAVIKDDRICLLQRAKRPYKGYWGMIGGKVQAHESLEETAVREVKEETGLDVEFDKLHAVIHERVAENNAFKHGFALFLASVKVKGGRLKQSDEGRVDWFALEGLNKDMLIPSDYWMITQCLGKKFKFASVVLHEENEKLVKMDINA
ncbi:NUDIX domain-containing protein [Candidatus Woesearchaeota archaeon]|nr:NUDIX domain-containing protein [Candidatus Woesearchaeota archaeon]